MEFTIDKSKWLRGEGSTTSKLLRSSDGKMCCLGFFGLACGLTTEEIKDESSPDTSNKSIEAWGGKGLASWLFHNGQSTAGRTQDCSKLMEANDHIADEDEKLTEADRERLITLLFASNGVTVKFIDHE